MPSPSPNIRPYALSPLNVGYVVQHGELVPPAGRVRRRAVAICGSGGTRALPFDDPDVELWGINNFWNAMRDDQDRLRADRWWEMHQIVPDVGGAERGLEIQNANDMRWIDNCPVPLYTTEPWPANPNALVWPIGYFAKKYRDYFACTFAMQIVQAFDEGFEELQVYGLELLLGTKREATVESSCVNYWLGYVEGRGMKVRLMPVPERGYLVEGAHSRRMPQFLLSHPFRYGHDYWRERRWVEGYVARWDERPVAI